MYADITSKIESIDKQISELKGKKLDSFLFDNKIGDLDENLEPQQVPQECAIASSSAVIPNKDRTSSSSIIDFILPES